MRGNKFIKTPFMFWLIVLLSISNVFAQRMNSRKSDRINDGVKGDVKSIQLKRFSLKVDSGNIVGKSRLIEHEDLYEIRYDVLGNLVEERRQDIFGLMIANTIWEFDANGKLLGKNQYHRNDYGKNKKLLELEVIDSIKYDEKGNLIEEKVCHPSGSLLYFYAYGYDSLGNRVLCSQFDSKGEFAYKITYKYDANGNRIEERNYSVDGSLKTRLDYFYDSNGIRFACHEYGPNNLAYSSDSMEFNEQGFVSARTWWKWGYGVNYTWVKSVFNSVTYTYKYDRMGNWIKRWLYNADGPLYLDERKIRYY